MWCRARARVPEKQRASERATNPSLPHSHKHQKKRQTAQQHKAQADNSALEVEHLKATLNSQSRRIADLDAALEAAKVV